MVKIPLILLTLFSLSSCLPVKWEVKIESPKNNYVLPTEEAILPLVLGSISTEGLKEDEKKKILELRGQISCNGIKGDFTGILNWKVQNVPLKNFDPSNLTCELKTKKQTFISSITIASHSQEVPDPGEAGMQTLAGIDSDNDGVRDDIQVWINTSLTDPDKKNALKQLARASQKSLLEHEDQVKSIANVRAKFRASDCTYFIAGEEFDIQYGKLLQANMLNTKERLLASFRVSKHFHGEATMLKNESANDCDFELKNKKEGK